MSLAYCTVLGLDQHWHVAVDQTDDTSRSFITFEDALLHARAMGRRRSDALGAPCLLRIQSPDGDWRSEVVDGHVRENPPISDGSIRDGCILGEPALL